MNTTGIKLVCFDIGGVMLRITRNWRDAVRRTGIDHLVDGAELCANARFIEINHQFEKGQIDQNEYAEVVSSLAKISLDEVMTLLDAWLIQPYAGFDALLDKLSQTTIQTACLSNTNHMHWQVITTQGSRYLPLERLNYRFASPFVGHRKPERAIYEHVERETKTEPESILFFDDDRKNCHAAAEQGWHVHLIDPQKDPILQATEHLERHGVILKSCET